MALTADVVVNSQFIVERLKDFSTALVGSEGQDCCGIGKAKKIELIGSI